jgi:hypothetical protein
VERVIRADMSSLADGDRMSSRRPRAGQER